MKDFSKSNPKLHRLYVTYAQQDLEMIDRFIRELSEHSRVHCSMLIGALDEERAKFIKEEAAYREAAWRLLAHEPITDYEQEPGVEDGIN